MSQHTTPPPSGASTHNPGSDPGYLQGDPLNLLRPGSNTCRCTACGEYFSNDRSFTRHRRDGKCLDPTSRGLTQDKRGIWRRAAPNLAP
jgi:uncharacterized C2H2 Zn-finger protein